MTLAFPVSGRCTLTFLCLATAASGLLNSQSDTWNSTFSLSAAQIAAANLSSTTVHNVEVALNFERSNNAGNLVQDDPFYTLPSRYNAQNLPPPGTVLKVEENTNISLYTIPMSLSMSRFLYVSETLNGSSVPASAYVLWPYVPRKFAGLTPSSGNKSCDNQQVFPVLAHAHGTSGQTQACAPSGLRNLWDDFHEPFAMALAGYAVVATDYAGLGVPNVPSPYFILPAQANDVFHALAAAQSAWPDLLSKQFVVTGQSHGGGTAWAAAQRQYTRPVPGYLGTLAASPFTDVLADITADAAAENNARVAGIAQGLDSVLANFTLADWLTPAGIARWQLLHEIQGCLVTGGQLFTDATMQFLQPGWNTTAAARWYSQHVSNGGGQPFAGPMLVLQGTDDGNANEPVTTTAVEQTCAAHPESQLRYIRYQNISHVPVLYAGQHTWLDWIYDRFAGVEMAEGCEYEVLAPPPRINGAAFAGWYSQTWLLLYDQFGI